MLEMNGMSQGAKVLVVEDEEPLALLLRYNLEAEGYSVEVVHRGDEAEVAIAESSPDLIVLDWMLPGISGLELCRRLRTGKDSRTIPIILLTARSEETDRIRGLTTGADDYVVKPFSPAELVARVDAVLRRVYGDQPDKFVGFLEICFRTDCHVARVGGEKHFCGRACITDDQIVVDTPIAGMSAAPNLFPRQFRARSIWFDVPEQTAATLVDLYREDGATPDDTRDGMRGFMQGGAVEKSFSHDVRGP